MAAELINLRRIVGDDNVVSSAQKPYEEELNNLLTLAKSRGFLIKEKCIRQKILLILLRSFMV